jgi:hypothetical protein
MCLVNIRLKSIFRICERMVEKPIVHRKQHISRKTWNDVHSVKEDRFLESPFSATVNGYVNLVVLPLTRLNNSAFHTAEIQVGRLCVEDG